MRYTIKLPQDQQDIVVDALRIYKETIESLCPTKEDAINGKHFDLQGLIGIFEDKEIEIRVEHLSAGGKLISLKKHSKF